MTDTPGAPDRASDPTPAHRPDLAAGVAALQAMNPNSLMHRMGIEGLEATAQRRVATIPVEGNTQPYGLLHGGASVVPAATRGSIRSSPGGPHAASIS